MNLAHTLVAGMALTALIGLVATADAKGPPADKGSKNARARSRMVRPADADGNAKGRIDIATMKNGRSSLRVMGQNLTPRQIVDFVIVGDEGDEILADDVAVNDEGGAHVFLRSHKGDTLPLGAASAADLAGRVVSIRDNEAEPADLLTGNVPALGASDLPRRFRGRTILEPETDSTARGRVRLLFRRRDGRSRLVIGVAGLTEGDAVSFQIADVDEEATLTEVGTATATAEGTARYVVRTDHGDALPLGAKTALDLGGRAVEVHVNDAPALRGVLPGGE